MKRFFVLTLVLLASGLIRGKEDELPPKSPIVVPKAVAKKVSMMAKTGKVETITTSAPPKVTETKKTVAVPVTVLTPSGKPVKAMKFITRVHKNVMQEKTLIVYKTELQKAKEKLRELRKRIITAPPAQRPLFVKQKRVFRRECQALKAKIRVVKQQLKAAQKLYIERKLKKLATKSKKVKECLLLLNPKLRELKAKMQTTRDSLKIAPPKAKRMLVIKLQKLANMIAKVKVDIRTKKGKEKNIVKNILKFKEKVIKTTIVATRKKLYKTTTKISKAKDKIVTFKFKVELLQKRLSNIHVSTPKQRVKAAKIKVKIDTLNTRVNKLKTVVKNLNIIANGMRKEVRFQTTRLQNVKKMDRCADLTKKLAKELKRTKQLQALFNKECKQAVGTKRPADTLRAMKITAKIHAAKTKINVLKQMINAAKGSAKRRLRKGGLIQVQVLKAKRAEVKKLQTELKTLTVKCSKAIGAEKKELERQKVVLLKRIAAFKKEIIDLQRKAVLLKVSIAKKCSQAIIKEKARSKELMDEAAKKLKLARSEAFKLAQAVELAKKAARLEAEAHKLKVVILETTNKKTAAQLAAKRGTLLAKAAEYRNLVKTHQMRAQMIRKTLELRSAKELARVKISAARKERLYAEKIKDAIEKSEALRKAMEQATEAAVKDALREQHDLEVKRLNKYNVKMKVAQDSLKAAMMEIGLQKKALEELKKESALKAIMYQKKLKLKFAKMKAAFDIKKKAKITQAVNVQTSVENNRIAKLKQKIKLIQAEFKAFKVALQKAHIEKTARLLTSQKVRFEALLAKLQKKLLAARKEYEQYKVEFEKESSAKLKAIIKESKEATMKKIKEIEDRIKGMKADAKAQEVAARRSYMLQLKERRKAADQQIALIRLRIKQFQAQMLKKQIEIEKETTIEITKSKDLKANISTEKKKQAEDAKDFTSWEAQQKQNLAAVLKSKKKSTDQQLVTLKQKADKAKEKALRIKADLKVKLQAALNDIANHKKALKEETVRYHGLVREFDQYKLKAERNYVKGLTAEKAKRTKLSKEKNASLEACRKLVLKNKKKALDLQDDITHKFEEISHWNEEEKKRAEARAKVAEYNEKMLKLRSKMVSSQSSYEETCSEDKDNPECVAIRTIITETEATISGSSSKLEAAIPQFFSLSVPVCIFFT